MLPRYLTNCCSKLFQPFFHLKALDKFLWSVQFLMTKCKLVKKDEPKHASKLNSGVWVPGVLENQYLLWWVIKSNNNWSFPVQKSCIFPCRNHTLKNFFECVVAQGNRVGHIPNIFCFCYIFYLFLLIIKGVCICKMYTFKRLLGTPLCTLYLFFSSVHINIYLYLLWRVWPFSFCWCHAHSNFL